MAKKPKENSPSPSFKEWLSGQKSIEVKSFSEAAKDSELIFNCTGGMVSLEALKTAGADNLGNKVLVDVANPLDFSNGMPPSLNPVNTDSLAEQIQATYPDVRVVKALNTMNAFIMVEPSRVKGDHQVFMCGNDSEAKESVKEILKSFGWKEANIIDLGDVTSARGMEMILPIWLRLWGALGTSEFNFHIQRN